MTADTSNPSTPPHVSPVVLLVAADPVLLKQLRQSLVLTTTGWRIIATKHVKTAHLTLHTTPVMVVFLDHSGLDGDSIEFSAIIKQHWSNTRVVLMTPVGEASAHVVQPATVDYVLLKPFSQEQVQMAFAAVWP
jgi:DNA-binding NtrC family response regulator